MSERKKGLVFEVEQDPEERAGKLVDHAEYVLDDSERRLAKGTNGSRAVALQGIGYALCSIARTLGRIADRPDPGERPILPGATGPDPGGHEWYRGECVRCGLGLNAARPDCAARGLRLPATPVDPSAVLCIDCQKAHRHGPARCMYVTSCTVCVGDDPNKCACCAGVLVLDERNPAAGVKPVSAYCNVAGCNDIRDQGFLQCAEHSVRSDAALTGVGGGRLSCGCAVGHHEDRYARGDELDGIGNRCSLWWPREPQPDKPAAQSGCTAYLRCGCVLGHHPDRHVVSRADFKGGNNCSLGWPRATEPNKAAASTCKDPAHWCSVHCPPNTDDGAIAGLCCGEEFVGCSEHCS